MAHFRPAPVPPICLGMTSLVLGTIALLLFLLPILALPIGLAGLVVGMVGLAAALGGWPHGLRWSVLGIAFSLLSLTMVLAIAWVPAGYIEPQRPLPTWLPPANRPRVPPPARPNWWQSAPSAQRAPEAVSGQSAQDTRTNPTARPRHLGPADPG